MSQFVLTSSFRSLRCMLVALGVAVASCSGADAPDDAPPAFPAEPYAVITSAGGALRMEIRTSPEQPPQRGLVTAQYTITNVSGAPVDALAIDASLWMPAMGHGASVKPTAEPLGQGRYLLRNISLFMAGRWELRAHFSGPLDDDATVAIDVP